MNSGLTTFMRGSARTLLTGVSLALILAACGGGGGSAGTTGGMGAGTTGSTGSTGSGSTAPIAVAAVTLSVVDGTGAAVSTVSGGQTGVVRAKFVNSKGVALPNAVVKFTASDTTLLQFTPASGSALTDSSGIATINVKPVDFTSSGALTISGQAVLGTDTATGVINLGIGAAPLVVGTLSFSPTPSAPLPAFSITTLNVPVTSSGQPATTAPGLTLTSLCSGDGTATLVAGAVSNGVASVTYTNKGCIRGTDVITAAIGTSSQSISLAVGSANIGTVNFVNSDLSGTSLVLKGTGGLGRKEAALLTFKVVDQSGTGLAGVNVNFTATTSTGGLKVLPTQATTDSSGNVATSILSGTIPTPVRVIAQASRNGSTITGISDNLTISTGFPIQKAMSLTVDQYNIEGGDYDGVPANVTVRMADQYGNPISDGATINFVSEGGAIGSSLQGACQTVNGGCTVPLLSQNFRPINGRVTVLAYAQGIEDFVDSNGDGQYSCTNYTSPEGTPAPAFRPLIDTCISGGEPFTDQGDAFLDAGSLAATTRAQIGGNTLDGTYTASNGDLPFPYNHPTYTASGDGHWGLNYIRASAEITFSKSGAKLIRQANCGTTGCRDWDVNTDGPVNVVANLAGASCSAQTVSFYLVDSNNNPLPFGTAVAAVDADKISAGTFFPATVPSTSAIGGTFHQVVFKPDSNCAAGSLTISVTTPKGNGTAFPFKSN